MSGNSGNGSRHNRFNLQQRNEGLLACRESKRRRSKDVSDCLEHHIHQHQFSKSSNVTRALCPAALGARRRRIFHATNTFATRTHETHKETIKVLLQRRNYHKSTNRKARSRTSKHLSHDTELYVLTRRLPTNEEEEPSKLWNNNIAYAYAGGGGRGVVCFCYCYCDCRYSEQISK